jgi:hypothetical protein
MPGASLSPTEVVHSRHCGYPNGGRTHGDKGEPLIQPRSSNLAIGTVTLPGGGQVPFLATKIVPARFRGLVARARLLAILSELSAKRLGVIKAPAGFGKSSLAAALAEKLEQSGNCVGWLSIDSDDDEATRFSILRISGPAPCVSGRWRRRDWANPREQPDRPDGDPVKPDQRSGGDRR